MPMTGRSAMRLQSLRRLGDQLIHDRLEIVGALVRRELAIRARAAGEDLVRVRHLLPAAQLVHHIADEPLEQLTDEIACGQLDAFAEIDELPVQAVTDGAPFVLLDEVGRIHTQRHVVAPQLPELRHHRLEDRGDAYGLVHARAHVTDAEFERGIGPVGAHIPPDLGAIGNTLGGGQHVDHVGVFTPRAQRARHARARKAAEHHRAIGLEPRVAPHPERRAGGETEDMRQHVARHVERVDQELPVLDADVDMRPEDQEALRQLAHRLPQAEVALGLRDLLPLPGRERMRARRGDSQSVLRGQADDFAAQLRQLGAQLGGRLAHLAPHLHDRLMQLRLHLREHQMVLFEDLCDVRLELASPRIDDLIFLFNAERQRGRLHRGSTSMVGTWEPPPAVTLTSAAVDRRDRQPSTYVPWQAKGSVSRIRSAIRSVPSTTLGYGSRGTGTRSCTTCGSANPCRTRSCHTASVTSQPSTTPFPPYSSFGLSTSRSRCETTNDTRSISFPSWRVLRSSNTRVQGMCAAIACRSSAENCPAFCSSPSAAKLAFLWSTLQRNPFTMQTARLRTARTTAWSTPQRSISSLIRTRL